MANTRHLRRRIKSVKNTAQITKAMQMVAASKMRRAQQQAAGGKPYANLINKILVSLREHVDPRSHPLLEQREVKKELILLVSTDRGLCGPLNTNLFREAAKCDPETCSFVSVGKKARQFLARMRRNLLADFTLDDPITFSASKKISKFCLDQFLSGEVDQVRVAFPEFVNVLIQQPQLAAILPISPIKMAGIKSESEDLHQGSVNDYGYLFEPSPSAVLDSIVPHYVHFEIFQMFLDARASEHSARMVAMKSATDNANQLVKDLALEYNKVRQAAITTEILEISTAQMSLA